MLSSMKVLLMATLMVFICVLSPPEALADNRRLNNAVVSIVYQIQHNAGCTSDAHQSPQLRLAAQWHTNDVLNNRYLYGDIGSNVTRRQNSQEQYRSFRPINPSLLND